MILVNEPEDALRRQTGFVHFFDGGIAVVIVNAVIIIDAVAQGRLSIRVSIAVQILKAGKLY